MKTAHRLVRNTGFGVLSLLLDRLASSLFFIIISRSFGVAVAGAFSTALSYFFVGSRFSFWGLDHLLTREVARLPEDFSKYLSNFVILRLFFSILVLVVVGVLIGISGYQDQTKILIAIVAISIVFESVKNILAAAFVAFEKLDYVSIISLVSGSVKILLALLLARTSAEVLAAAFTVSNLIAVLIGLYMVTAKLPRFGLDLDFRFALAQLRIALPFFFVAMFFILDNRLDVVLLSMLSTDYEVGLYSAAVSVVTALSMIPQGFRTSIFPILARYQKTSEDAMKRLYKKATKYLIVFALPATLGTMAIAGDIVSLVYGSSFAASAWLLQIVIWSFLTYCLTVIASRLLIVWDQQSRLANSLFLSALVTVVLNLLLVPRMAATGASIAKVVSSIVLLTLVQWTVMKRLRGTLNLWSLIWRPLLAAVGMLACVLLTDPLGVIIQIVVGICIYLLLMMLLGGLTSEEIEMWRALWKTQLNYKRGKGV